MANKGTTKEKFYSVKSKGVGTLIFRSPNPSVQDLVVKPFVSSVIDYDLWRKVPHFVRALTTGQIVLSETDDMPLDERPALNPELEAPLDYNYRRIATEVCFTETVTEPYLSAINVGDLLGATGVPSRNASRVTKSYLIEKHAPFLRATLDLEKRFRNRKEVVGVL